MLELSAMIIKLGNKSHDISHDLSLHIIYSHSKLFLRHNHLEQLETQIKVSHKAAVVLQSIVLGFLQRKRYEKLLKLREVHKKCLRNLLQKITSQQDKVWSHLERLCNQDEKRYLAGIYSYNFTSHFIIYSPSSFPTSFPNKGERQSMILQDSFSLPKLGPPGDLHGNLPPPLLLISVNMIHVKTAAWAMLIVYSRLSRTLFKDTS